MQGSEHKPTDETRAKVREWAENGVTQDRIAKALGISDPKTVRKHYRDELDTGGSTFDAEFESSLGRDVRKADCAPALRIFMAKVKLGYRETVALDPTKEGPLANLSLDELRARNAERARAAREAGQGLGGRPGAAGAA